MAGQGAFGAVPGVTGLPNPSADLAAQYPGLSGTNAQLSANILSRLKGEIPMDVQNKIQDAGARFGVTSGMPGSGLANAGIARNLGLTSLDLQNQGVQQYNQTIPTISGTQTVRPETQIGLSQSNAALKAAPDPTQAAAASLDIQDRYMNMLANRNRNPASGTGTYANSATGQPIINTPTATRPQTGGSSGGGYGGGGGGYLTPDEEWFMGQSGVGPGTGRLVTPDGRVITYDPQNGVQGQGGTGFAPENTAAFAGGMQDYSQNPYMSPDEEWFMGGY
jgi:hypothetical protein